MDGYNIIALKGQISKYMTMKGKTKEEIFEVFGEIGSSCAKAQEVLATLKKNSHPLTKQVVDLYDIQ